MIESDWNPGDDDEDLFIDKVNEGSNRVTSLELHRPHTGSKLVLSRSSLWLSAKEPVLVESLAHYRDLLFPGWEIAGITVE